MKALAVLCICAGLSGCVAVPVLPHARMHVAPVAPVLVVRPALPGYYGALPGYYGYGARHSHNVY